MKERRLLEQLPNPKKALAIGFLILTTACSSPAVVNGVEIDRSSACTSGPITETITPETTGVILFGEKFPVKEGRICGFSVNTQTGRLEANVGDINGDGNPDTIKASVAGNQITASLECGTEQNTGSNK
jgi:hypothetical protein